MNQLQDGTGDGFLAKVDADNRLYTNAITRSEIELAALLGNSYNVNIGLINLTNSGVDNAVFYIKNTGSSDLIIYEMLIILGTTTGGSGDGTIKVFRNPTTGTIISSALDVESKVNRDFASFKSLSADIYKGATGSTMTNGEIFGSTNRAGSSVFNFSSTPIILRTGNSLGVTFAPSTGNTSQSIRVATTIFSRTNEI